MTIRVLVVDDHVVVRRGLTGMLAVLDGVECVGQAADGHEALAELVKLVQKPPDVVLLDLMMSGMDGAKTAREIVRLYPRIRVVILTGFDDMARVHSALTAGAAGYVLKTAGATELETAIRAAAKNQSYLDPAVARRITESLTIPATPALSERENQILALLGEGMSNIEIATDLQISERTARNHVSAVLSKLSLTSRTQAALHAVRNGVVRRTD